MTCGVWYVMSDVWYLVCGMWYGVVFWVMFWFGVMSVEFGCCVLVWSLVFGVGKWGVWCNGLWCGVVFWVMVFGLEFGCCVLGLE